MLLQRQFVADHACRAVNVEALISAVRRIYSKSHAKRVLLEIATATNDRLLALTWNVTTWARVKGEVVEPDALFDGEAVAAAERSTWQPPAEFEAPQGATLRQMARLCANFEALGVLPGDAFEIVRELDGRAFGTRAERFTDASAGFKGGVKGGAWRSFLA